MHLVTFIFKKSCPTKATIYWLRVRACLFCFLFLVLLLSFSPFFFPYPELFIFLMTFEDILNRKFSCSSRSAATQFSFRTKEKVFIHNRMGLKHYLGRRCIVLEHYCGVMLKTLFKPSEWIHHKNKGTVLIWTILGETVTLGTRGFSRAADGNGGRRPLALHERRSREKNARVTQ